MEARQARAGIPTRGYDGTRFRSRLEARWAHFFDLLGWRWEYEPFDLAGYIPDFLIFGSSPFLVEVKPYSTTEETLYEQCRLPACDNYAQLVVGVSPLLSQWVSDSWEAGNLWSPDLPHDGHWSGGGLWIICQECDGFAIDRIGVGDGQPRVPCGHRNSRAYLYGIDGEIRDRWVVARNATQWKAQWAES